MTVTSIYPVIMTSDVPGLAAFFRENFGYEAVFEADWYISLRKDAWELAVLKKDHPTVPAGFRAASEGLLINIEVEDADAAYAELVQGAGLCPVLDIRSEDFGQRHFILEAPGGVLVDVIQPIEFSGEFAT